MTARGPSAFFDNARSILIEDGPDALTIAALCERMHVTKGSFYHHFPAMPEFVAAFVEAFELEHLMVVAAIKAEPDPVQRINLANAHALEMASPFYAAMRAWGLPDPSVRGALMRVSEEGESVLLESFAAVVGDPHRAHLLAEMAIALLIGLQQRARPTRPERLAEILAEFSRVNLGLDVSLVPAPDGPRLTASRRTGPTTSPPASQVTPPS